jgi:hypothetical protein
LNQSAVQPFQQIVKPFRATAAATKLLRYRARGLIIAA